MSAIAGIAIGVAILAIIVVPVCSCTFCCIHSCSGCCCLAQKRFCWFHVTTFHNISTNHPNCRCCSHIKQRLFKRPLLKVCIGGRVGCISLELPRASRPWGLHCVCFFALDPCLLSSSAAAGGGASCLVLLLRSNGWTRVANCVGV